MSESDAADAGIEMRCERREEHRIIQQHIAAPQLSGQHQQLGRQDRVPHTTHVGWSFTVLSTMASIPSSPRGEAILSSNTPSSGIAMPRRFRSK
jgi:hypothetical protein